MINRNIINWVKFASIKLKLAMIQKLSILLFSSLFTVSLHSFGQENEDWRLYRPGKTVERQDSVRERPQNLGSQPTLGEITFIEDSRITHLNERKKEYPTKLDGYRVQIYFGDRNTAQEKRGAFVRSNPEMGAYLSYLAPNFRLRVGDFRSRLEAEKFKKAIAQSFPGCYIVKDKIELPPLEEAKANELETPAEN